MDSKSVFRNQLIMTLDSVLSNGIKRNEVQTAIQKLVPSNCKDLPAREIARGIIIALDSPISLRDSELADDEIASLARCKLFLENNYEYSRSYNPFSLRSIVSTIIGRVRSRVYNLDFSQTESSAWWPFVSEEQYRIAMANEK